MSINSEFEKHVQGELRAPLIENESIIKSGIATWQPSKSKVLNVDLYLTNKRLIIQDNLKSAEIISIGGTLGGFAGGGVAGALGGNLGAKQVSKTKNGGISFFLSDITNITPGKYMMFGLIPTRDTALNITLRDGTTVTIIFYNRSEWLDQINNTVSQLTVSS